MANQFLSQLHAAAHRMNRPRFATDLVIAMASLADEKGLIHASREDLAMMVDRSEYQSRRDVRLQRVKSRTKTYKQAVETLQQELSAGEISHGVYQHEIAALTDEYRKYVRSPTLANVSNVISQFRDSNLMSVSYVDPDTGLEFDTTARGRFARYRFVLPNGSMPVFLSDEVSVPDSEGHVDPSNVAGETVLRSAKPICHSPPSASKSNQKNAHQLSLL
tara:strand:- start:16426 stop:17082 length:657 start_codon:yes stop_codon:yes gene_type:complete